MRRARRQRRSRPGKAPHRLERSTRRQNSWSFGKTVLRLVAGDDARIDGADRGADQPVRLDAGVVQRLIDAALIGAERASALQHEHDLAVIGVADLVGGFQRGKASGVAMFFPPVCFFLSNGNL